MFADSILLTANKVKVAEVLEELDSRRQGLSPSMVESRRQRFGFNEYQEEAKPLKSRLLDYFWKPLPVLIILASVFSLVLHQYISFAIIAALFASQTILQFWKNHRQRQYLMHIQSQLAIRCNVHRDGNWVTQPARNLVPGDIILLQQGDIVPADVKLIGGDSLTYTVPGSADKVSREKHILDEIQTGCIISDGKMIAIVERTGEERTPGYRFQLDDQLKSRSLFESGLLKIGNYFTLLAILLAWLLILTALFHHDNLLMALQFTSIFIAASVPAASPAVLFGISSVGSSNLSRKRVLLNKGAAIQQLAGMDVLCTGKTGILTRNMIAVGEPLPATGYTKNDVIFYAALASDKGGNNPIDHLFLDKMEENQDLVERQEQYHIIRYNPFNSETRREEVVAHNQHQTPIRVTKGAPQDIIALSDVPDTERERLQNKIEDLAGMGYHTLGVAVALSPGRWHLIGLVPLFDPPREDSAKTIKALHSLGIKAKILTGDALFITREFAHSLTMGTDILQLRELERGSSLRLDTLVEEADGFAELFPEQKFLLIKHLQRLGHTAGMIGDSINEAPALQIADCGIAAAGAADAVRSAADTTLESGGIGGIIDAIKESRKIIQRLRNYAIFRFTESLRTLLFLTLAALSFHFFPITAAMLALLLLLHTLPVFMMTKDPVNFSNQPEKSTTEDILRYSLPMGLLGVVFSFLLLYLGMDIFHLTQPILQSFIFLYLALAGQLTLLSSRNRGFFWKAPFSGGLFLSQAASGALATVFVIFGWFITPLHWQLALFIWGYSLGVFFFTDGIKASLYRFFSFTDRWYTTQRLKTFAP